MKGWCQLALTAGSDKKRELVYIDFDEANSWIREICKDSYLIELTAVYITHTSDVFCSPHPQF
jgi:hypothetical protein